MAVWSEVALKSLTDDGRLDSDYYRAEYLRQEQQLSNIPLIALEQVAFVSDGNHLSISEDFVKEGVRYLRGQDLNDFFISDTNSAYISHETYKLLTRSHMKTDDVLLSIVGTVGNVAVVTPKYDVLTGSCKIAILRPFAINPLFLAAYLSSKIGQDQLKRRVRGAVQQGLILPDLKHFPIPQLSENAQDAVAELVAESQHQRNRSLELYTEAETLLLDALGLNDLEATHAIAYERNFQEVARAGRFDAEYFKPKYTELMNALDKASQHPKWSVETIGELSAPLKYGTSSPLDYISSGVPFLRIADVVKDDFDRKSLKYISAEQATLEKGATVRTDDVIISRSGTLGLTIAISDELDGAIFGSYFIRTRPNTNKLHPLYLSLFMNALPGRLQVQRNNTGGVQTNLTIPAIESIRVAFPSYDEQKEILQKVWDSRRAAQDAQSLLESAKQRVEELIEGADS